MRPFRALAAVVFAVAAASAEVPAPQPPAPGEWPLYRFAEDGFSIRLPGDWRPIPEMHMRRFAQGAIAKSLTAGEPATQNFRYGFQKEPVAEWFRCPYLVIDIRNTGRVPWRELRGLPRIESIVPETPATPSALFARLAPGQYCYDRARDVIWLNLQDEKSGPPPQRILSALRLTQKGVIQVNAYIPGAQAAQFQDDFERIANGMTAFPEIAYQKPRLETWAALEWLDWSNPPMRHIEIAVTLLLGVSLCSLAAVLYRRTAAQQDSRRSRLSV